MAGLEVEVGDGVAVDVGDVVVGDGVAVDVVVDPGGGLVGAVVGVQVELA